MRNIHPSTILKMKLVEGKKLSVSKTAESLTAKRLNISNNSSISPNMVLRLEKVFERTAKHF